MKTQTRNADVILSGAGPAGSALAVLLAQAGFQITLIDAEQPLSKDLADRPSGRTAALLNGSVNILKAAGIWDGIKDFATPLRVMKIVDDSLPGNKQVETIFRAAETGRDCFGYNIPNNLLRQALVERVKSLSGIDHLCPDRLSGYTIEGGHITARTENGAVIKAPLIVGTDGRNSVVRAVAAIEAKKHDYGQTAITCLIEHSKPHHFTSTEFHRSGGPFTFVPMEGNTSSVVWVEKHEDAKALLSMPRQAFQQALQDRSHGLLGTITLKSLPESWPLMLLSAERVTGERAALAAEAAHVISPIGAQGLNLSLRDIAALAETITDAARLGEDIGSASVLSRYERRRRTDIKSHVIGIDGLNRAVANDRSFMKDLRRIGIKTVESFPPLKSLVIHQGLIPSMDEGRLLAGEGL